MDRDLLVQFINDSIRASEELRLWQYGLPDMPDHELVGHLEYWSDLALRLGASQRHVIEALGAASFCEAQVFADELPIIEPTAHGAAAAIFVQLKHSYELATSGWDDVAVMRVVAQMDAERMLVEAHYRASVGTLSYFMADLTRLAGMEKTATARAYLKQAGLPVASRGEHGKVWTLEQAKTFLWCVTEHATHAAHRDAARQSLVQMPAFGISEE